MKTADFKKHGITDFKPEEIARTGALLADVQLRTVIALQVFRRIMARRVGLLVNGITTGDHKAAEHFLGLAVDGYLYPDDGIVDISIIFKAALAAGFKGIGIYWNGQQYSFHLDLRSEFSFWAGYKNKSQGVTSWAYMPILNDPGLLSRGV